MSIALLAPLLLAAGTADVSKLDCPAIIAKDDYTDDYDLCITVPIDKPLYEEGMTCLGRFQGLRALQIRITEFLAEDKRKVWTDQIASGDKFAAQLDGILQQAKADPDLDQAVGQAAYDAARAKLDDASTLGGAEQVKLWQEDPQTSKRCIDVLSFFSVNLSTRAAERPRPDEEDD